MNPTGTDLAVVKPWASRIRGHLQTGIESFILAGHDLDAAVEDFKQQNGKHWKHAYSELLAEVKISQQTAHTLRTIARHPILSDPSNYGSLPSSWSTLGELASLPSPELEQRIEAGEITPDLKRDQVREWKQLNHLPASGSPQPNVSLRPVIIGYDIPKMGNALLPEDLTLEEAFEISQRAYGFFGLFQERVRGASNHLNLYLKNGDSSLLPPQGDSTDFQMLSQHAGAPVFWMAILTDLESGRAVVGVLVDIRDKIQKRPDDSRGAANTEHLTGDEKC